MYKKLFIIPLFLLLGYGLSASSDFKIIAAGIAIFIVGMFFMEDGFKLFTGGSLAKILEKTTNNVPKAIFSGFVSTTIVQSSSLVSIIAISFLSAELMALPQALGIIFGSNIGSTTTAWIVSSFGMKIKIAHYAMPMLVFGVICTFFKSKPFKGVGYILLGLGFIFLGIGFMKDGFETLQSGINLADYALEGFLGIAVYIMVGAGATVIIQSSGATMALIITAVATGQITYINAIALAIGANIGTTVTAALGALTSNADGKRLAVAHFIFNMITALFAVLFINPLIGLVEASSQLLGIGQNDMAMKLSLFHTIFNVAGVLIVTPFLKPLVKFLQGLFIYRGEKRGLPKFLDDEVIKTSGPAIEALRKETEHLYDSISHLIIQALRLHRHEVWSKIDLRKVMETVKGKNVDVDHVYGDRIKNLYSHIIRFAVLSEEHMDEEERHRVYNLKLANRDMIEVIKDIRELQKNIAVYMVSKNKDIALEYNLLREKIAAIIRDIDIIRHNPDDVAALTEIEMQRAQINEFDTEKTRRISALLRENKINDKMASSLMNDSAFTKSVLKRLLECAAILWLEDETIREINRDLREGEK